jgi:hypothetical protein
MKQAVAFFLLLLSLGAQAQSLSYRIDIAYPGASSVSYELKAMQGTKASVQNVSTQTDIAEINSNFGEITQVPVERASGMTATVTPQEVDKDGKVLTSLTYTIWKQGQQAAKGTHVLQMAPGSKVALPTFKGHNLAIMLLK